jgi:hypothetical protein
MATEAVVEAAGISPPLARSKAHGRPLTVHHRRGSTHADAVLPGCRPKSCASSSRVRAVLGSRQGVFLSHCLLGRCAQALLLAGYGLRHICPLRREGTSRLRGQWHGPGERTRSRLIAASHGHPGNPPPAALQTTREFGSNRTFEVRRAPSRSRRRTIGGDNRLTRQA